MATDTTNLSPEMAALSPAMRQYRTAKDTYPDSLLFFRMGDFYELFFEDAIVASRELQLTLTARDKAKSVPMCGVPYHAAEGYLQRLLRKGFRVAICEQMEDPKLAKGVVKREVTRVLTPGTAIDPTLSAEQSNYLASVAIAGAGSQAIFGLAFLDLSTGEFRATEFRGQGARAQLVDELGRMRPVELLFGSGGSLFAAANGSLALDKEPVEQDEAAGFSWIRTKTPLDEWVFSTDHALPLLRRHFRVHSLDGLGLGGREIAGVAAGALLHYMQVTKQGGLEHVDALRFYERSSCLELDAVSVRNLELVEPLFSGETAQTTLFYTLDACCTPMGKRLLRATILRPSSEIAEIESRLDAVAEAGDLKRRETVRRAMDGILDLERLLARVSLDSAGPREVLVVSATLGCLPGLVSAAAEFTSTRWRTLSTGFDALQDLHDLIARTIADEPPVSISDGGVIREGVDAELDELRELSRSGRQALAAIEDREREKTGISSLKVRFNNVFGYYIEVTKANAKAVPQDYERKQTLVNAERFTTPELKEYETRILTAQERSGEIERRLFTALRRQLLDAATRMRETARRIAEIDMLACFAHLATLNGWVRPAVDGSGVLEFIGGRHPVVERRLEESGGGRFVPNSVHLDADAGPSELLITGPNMGGKSTYLRQTALLVIMAQCGCFVPAEKMRLGLVDRIYTRIGASDNVARGRSTFMVEIGRAHV